MTPRRFVLAIALLSAAPLPAQSTHPKFKSKEIRVGSIVVLAPRVYGSSRKVEASQVTSRSEETATDVAEIIDEVLNDLNWEIREPGYADELVADVQSAYDRLSLRLHDRPRDVERGLYAVGPEVAALKGKRSVDAIFFSRVNAEFDENTTSSVTATSISFTISYTRNIQGRFSLVDARTGEVLYFFEARGRGDDERSKKELKDNVTSQLKRIASLVDALPPIAVEPPKPGQVLPDAPKMAAWAGQRVTLLPTTPLQCNAKKNDGMLQIRRFGDDPNARRLGLNLYAGRTGTIVEATGESYEKAIVIQLDSGEKLISTNERGVAFNAELDSARKLIGTTWWSRGNQTLGHPDRLCDDFGGGGKTRITLRRLQKVTITGVAFGTHLQNLLFVVETEDGTKGIVDGWSGYDYLDERFHLVERQFGVPLKHYSDRFFLRNPR